MEPPELLLFGGFLIFVVAMRILSHRQEQKRRAAFQALAVAEGLEYDHQKREPPLAFKLYNQGHSRYARHRLSGQWDEAIAGLGAVPFHCYEYHYAITSGSGKNRRTRHYYFRCVLIEAGLNLGRVRLVPEGFGEKVAQFFGRQDIDLDDVDFNRRVGVQSDSPAQAYALLGRELMAWWPRSGDWHLEADGPNCLLYQPGSFSAGDYPGLKLVAHNFLDRLPRPLVNEERIRRGLPPILQAGVAALAPGHLDSSSEG
jgi:hypothetical protein